MVNCLDVYQTFSFALSFELTKDRRNIPYEDAFMASVCHDKKQEKKT
jgi:hypothetical protein